MDLDQQSIGSTDALILASVGNFRVARKSPCVKCLAGTNIVLGVPSLSASNSTRKVGKEIQEKTDKLQILAPCLHRGFQEE